MVRDEFIILVRVGTLKIATVYDIDTNTKEGLTYQINLRPPPQKNCISTTAGTIKNHLFIDNILYSRLLRTIIV